MTPRQAVRKYCLECAGTAQEVRDCGGYKLLNPDQGNKDSECIFYRYRLPESKGRISVKTIRKECRVCMGGSSQMIKDCDNTKCSLWNFRLGTNPNCPTGHGWQRKKASNLEAEEEAEG